MVADVLLVVDIQCMHHIPILFHSQSKDALTFHNWSSRLPKRMPLAMEFHATPFTITLIWFGVRIDHVLG